MLIKKAKIKFNYDPIKKATKLYYYSLCSYTFILSKLL